MANDPCGAPQVGIFTGSLVVLLVVNMWLHTLMSIRELVSFIGRTSGESYSIPTAQTLPCGPPFSYPRHIIRYFKVGMPA